MDRGQNNALAAAMLEREMGSDPLAESRAKLPRECFLWIGEEAKRSTWHLPYRTAEPDPKTGDLKAGPVHPAVVKSLATILNRNTLRLPAEIATKLRRIVKKHATVTEGKGKSSREIELLNFDAQFAAAKIDKAAGIVRHVAIMKSTSSGSSIPGVRGRRYTETALRSAAALSEGAQSYRNHQDTDERMTMGGIRKAEDLIGYFEGATLEGETIFGDLHYLNGTEIGTWLEVLVEKMPDKVGMSIHALGTAWYDSEDMMEVVDDIKEMRSIDLVTKPGSTKNLFESRSEGGAVGADSPDDGDDTATEAEEMNLSELKLADLQEHRPDLVTEIESSIKVKQEKDGELAQLRGQVKDLTEKNATLAAKVDTYEVEKKLNEREARIDVLVKESELPAETVTTAFRESLRAAKDEAGIKVLLEDRKKLVMKTTGGVHGMGAESTLTESTKGKKQTVSDADALKDYEEAAKE